MSLLSDYEQLRARNIERNNQRLRELGLISILEEQQSNDSAWGRHGSGSGCSANKDDTGFDVVATTKKKRKNNNNNNNKKRTFQESTNEPVAASRKSARLQGLDPELGGIYDEDDAACGDNGSGVNNRSVDQLRKDRVEECRSVRNKRMMLYGGTNNEEEDTKTFEKAKQENPTASYDHCLMRVRTMSQKQLQNRIKMIERAAGKHCVVKMAIFKCCLQDEDMWDLAELASEALERLKGLK